MNRIRELRLLRAQKFPSAFTAKEVSRRLGVSEATLRNWEGGIHRPSQRHARALARELGVSLKDLGLDLAED